MEATDERGSMEIPAPPVLLTTAHAMTTTAANNTLSVHAAAVDTGDESPIPPVLVTPGIQQVKKINSLIARKQAETLETTICDSPIPPVLQTPGKSVNCAGLKTVYKNVLIYQRQIKNNL